MTRKNTLVRNFIVWAVRRNGRVSRCRIVNLPEGTFSHFRFQPFWPEEWPKELSPTPVCRPPWWRPFNIVVNCWFAGDEQYHDHVRWSVTIMLKGLLVEGTPWGKRVLEPGSVVFRSHRTIHRFRMFKEDRGKVWTLFIVGRRNHPQNTYGQVIRTQQ